MKHNTLEIMALYTCTLPPTTTFQIKQSRHCTLANTSQAAELLTRHEPREPGMNRVVLTARSLPVTSDGWKRSESGLPSGKNYLAAHIPRGEFCAAHLGAISDVCGKYAEKSVLDTSPSGMRARIRACLPPSSSASVLESGCRHAYRGLRGCMCPGYELPASGNHSSTGRPLGILSGTERL